jgi:hypothetical protein
MARPRAYVDSHDARKMSITFTGGDNGMALPPSLVAAVEAVSVAVAAAVPSHKVCRRRGSHIHDWWFAHQLAILSSDAEGNKELTCCIYFSSDLPTLVYLK